MNAYIMASGAEDEDLSSCVMRSAGVEIPFSLGNPSVENIQGSLRLFRPVERTEGGKVRIPSTSEIESKAITALPELRSSTLCLLALPPSFIPADTFKFFGAFLQSMHRIRFVRQGTLELPGVGGNNGHAEQGEDEVSGSRDSLSSKMSASCILEFRTQDMADEFYLAYDGKKYSSLEEDTCRCVFVQSCKLLSEGEGIEKGSECPKEGKEAGCAGTLEVETEMPTCPVCLERLDAHITGIATTMCNHDFHPECLKKCTMTSCPVCRYSQMESEDAQRTQCQVCDGREDLWICIICGHVGCGRYARGHARTHWLETGHCYAMELQSQRVWDYVGDEYVHRLIRSKVDGQHYLVEVPANGDVEPMEQPGGSSERGEDKKLAEKHQDVILTSKLEAITLEYNHLLMAQLGSQTEYFEGQLQEMRQQVAMEREMSNAALSKARHLEASRKGWEKKLREDFEKENSFLKDLSESVLRDKDKWREEVNLAKSKLEEKDAVIKDLQEQVRDLMVYLEAQSMVSQHEDISQEEIRDSTVTLGSEDEDEDHGQPGSSKGRNATHARLKNKLKMKKTLQ
ncbi:BRAP2 RING ZnF UBP domain-containing protein [Chloropicon primus]|nr:BRAP2 RING ZnF UBP domain-containing protein [Chloropicon primus]